MKKAIIIPLLLLFPLLDYGQLRTSKKYDVELICQQFKAASSYLTRNKEFKSRKLRVDNLVRDGWGYEYFANLYTAKKLQVKPEDLWNQDKNKIGEMFQSFEGKPYLSGYKIDNYCFSKVAKPNAFISKLDNDSMLLHVTTNRLRKEGASGETFLFFFDESNNVESFQKTSWIN